ncbi:MAG: DinB family protein [Anaerolineae bacterium]
MNRQHTQLIERIQESSKELLDYVARLPEAELYRAPGGDEWSMHAILAHLRDTEEHVFLKRTQRILSEKEAPRVENFDQEKWNREHYSAQEPLKKILGDWRKARRKFVALLGKTPDKEWAHYAIHPEYGKISIEWLATHNYSHTLEHLHQLLERRERDILKQLNG